MFTGKCCDSYRSLYPQMGSGDPCQREDKPKVVTRPLRYGRPGALTNVSHVTVRVNRALSGSVALRSVQIWGQPSQFCSKPVVHWFLQVVESIKNPEIKEEGKEIVEADGKQRGKSQSAALTGCKSSESCPRSVDLPDCPEEFIDPITNEMLILPLLLPSGHTVDSETLRKHSEAEARWGRPPNDPFTGVPFSKSRQPLPNVKLKERLDRYLLEGGGNVTPPARDVGRSNGTGARKTEVAPASLIRLRTQQNESSTNTEAERLREAQLDKKEESKCLDGSETSSSPFAVQPQLQTETLRSEAKRKSKNDRLGQKLPRKKRPVLGMQHDQEASNCEHRQASPLISSSSPSTQASTSCHEDLLAQSLDAALENALSTLPSFNKKPLQQLGSLTDNANNKWTCSSCHKTLATKDGYHVNGPLNMYSLPCSHLICRDCLLSSSGRTNSQCSVCGIKFLTSEVTKVHV
ncbi:RING finger protein 37-like isoform X2 [Acanthaster planci]|uniref:RING finger protein 37-like isoform X2 n=1 Tax=Acanthaster planci TaxID=133434 RepID=A0A8B7YEW5_ACAPL|nr:RING finger protein 37-like isoform X2 [Acanthaster planci]